MKKHFRILSIDGGGIRGIMPGTVLCHIEEFIQEITQDKTARIADYFDMVAGTSTGGILACALLLPNEDYRPKFNAREVVDLYLKRGEDIFDIPLFHKIIAAGGLRDEKYPSTGIESALNDYFGDTKLAELLKPCLITSYDVTKRKAQFFRQHRAKSEGADFNFYVKDVARATSAAPTYFECANIKSESGVDYPTVDGGIFANNPSLCAYAETRNFFEKSAKEMVVLSLGTGSKKTSYDYDKVKNWGLIQWPAPLIDIMMSAVSETVDFQLKQIYEAIEMPDQYLRVTEAIPGYVNDDMDDATEDNMEKLQLFGDQVFENNKDRIKNFVKKYLLQDEGDQDLIA